VLDAALGAAAGPAGSGVDAGAPAAVLGLVELPVDDALQHDEDDAEERREEDDAHVRLEVPPLRVPCRNSTKISVPFYWLRRARGTEECGKKQSKRTGDWEENRGTGPRNQSADLEAEVLAEEGVSLRGEARGAPEGRCRVH
jgi:hypothetical protein